MEEKKVTKISLSTFFLIISLFVIIVMGIFMYKFYNEKIESTKESADLQTQVNDLTKTVNDLQGKIQNISATTNSNNSTENANPTNSTSFTDEQVNNVSSSSNVASQTSSVSKSQILSYYKERISAFSDSNHQYSVVDINNDDIPELFIYVTGFLGNQIIADTSVYTYDENKGDKSDNYVVGVGSVSGRLDTNTTLYKMNDGRLLSVYGHMGYECTTYFKLENDWLIRTEFSSKQTDNYMSGDTEIQFKPCTDTSLIDNFN